MRTVWVSFDTIGRDCLEAAAERGRRDRRSRHAARPGRPEPLGSVLVRRGRRAARRGAARDAGRQRRRDRGVRPRLEPELVFVVGWSQLVREPFIELGGGGRVRDAPDPPAAASRAGTDPVDDPERPGPHRRDAVRDRRSRPPTPARSSARSRFRCRPDETATSLFERLAAAHVSLIRELVPQLLVALRSAHPQDATRASSWQKRTPADGIIDWETRAPYLYDWVRAQTRPYPGAFTFLGDEKVIVWGARPVELDEAAPRRHDRRHGAASGPVVACGEGGLAARGDPDERSRSRRRSEARMTRVLVLAAHPDDEVLGMGGTIAVHTDRGDEVRVVVVTDGSSTQYPGDAGDPRTEGGRGAARSGRARRRPTTSTSTSRTCASTRSPHVDVNRVVEEQVRDHRARGRVHGPSGREPRPPRALRLGRGRDARRARARRVRRVLTYAPTSSTEWTPAPAQLVRPELVRRRDLDDRAEGGGVRALRDASGASIRIRAASPRSARPPRSTARAAAARTPSRSSSFADSCRCNVPALSRWPRLLLVLALLGATAAAFAVTERLKLERSPITGTHVDRIFSPVCDCARDVASISFVPAASRDGDPDDPRLERADGRDDRAEAARARRARRLHVGRARRARSGRSRGALPAACPARAERPHDRPSRTRSASTRRRRTSRLEACPAARLLARRRSDGATGSPRRTRSTSRRARRCSSNGRQRVLGQVPAAAREPRPGSVASTARSAPPGPYEIRLRAIDRAGTGRRAPARSPSVVRYVALSRERIEAVAGKRFSVRVSTDARGVRLALRGTSAESGRREVLVLRAPDTPGSYVLYVTRGRPRRAGRR